MERIQYYLDEAGWKYYQNININQEVRFQIKDAIFCRFAILAKMNCFANFVQTVVLLLPLYPPSICLWIDLKYTKYKWINSNVFYFTSKIIYNKKTGRGFSKKGKDFFCFCNPFLLEDMRDENFNFTPSIVSNFNSDNGWLDSLNTLFYFKDTF